MSDIVSILNNIKLIYDRKNIIKQITINKLTFEIYNLDKYHDLFKIQQYHDEIERMMKKCFGSHLSLYFKKFDILWVITKLENKVVAALLISMHKGEQFIWNVCRDPSSKYRGFGIGTVMIKWTLDYLKNNTSIEKIYLYAHPVPRAEFYKALGFVLTGKYNQGDPEMVYYLK